MNVVIRKKLKVWGKSVFKEYFQFFILHVNQSGTFFLKKQQEKSCVNTMKLTKTLK